MEIGKTIRGRRGVVAAGDRHTARAGAHALALGGNAVDAAVAAGMAAFVCEVALCAPLGGGVMLVREPGGEEHAIDFFGRTPGLGAPTNTALDFAEAVIDFGETTQSFRVGRGAAAIGLALPGLLEAHERWGTLPLTEVVAPAVALGREGYELNDRMAYIIELISPIGSWTAASKALFYKDDRLPRGGDQLFNAPLGDVLESLARAPARVADLYTQLTREFGPAAGGLITPRDIEAMTVEHDRPISVELQGWRLSTMPGPSTGGALIALGLRLLEGVGARTPFLSQAHLGEVVHVQRRLLETRDDLFDEQVRDRKFIDALLSEPSLAAIRSGTRPPAALFPDSHFGSTTQISALDNEGGVVAMTLTNGEGCGYVLDGTGIAVNNLLGEADINPRGFHTAPPGLRMSTMMAPSIAYGPNGGLLALGSGGSKRLRNAIMMTLSHVIEHGASLEEAVMAPRCHLDRVASGFQLNFEAIEVAETMVDYLAGLHPTPTVFRRRNMFFGGVHCVARLGGVLTGFGDPRRGGSVAGWP